MSSNSAKASTFGNTCKKDLASLNKKWLEAAGAKVVDVPIYLQTSASYCGEV
ncbi:hypothetical protein KIN20_026632 [Parelaphostrongylus tenuis]|uniref:Uncharacterized protein n=1 Tax=Parelaphostrongylus tenuis TaxID=148309 RepID=A0AAD5WD73_PARTN|nr:hypothetical protein KIN20_026632 [Parelaphostrongylus tenuis]